MDRPMDRPTAIRTVSRFVEAYHAATQEGGFGALDDVSTGDAVAAFLVESCSGTVMPLRSRTAVPEGARLDVDLDGVEVLQGGLVLAPFVGHGFAREDFQGEMTLHLDREGRVERARFEAP